MVMSLPATSRDSSLSERNLRDLCIFCIGILVFNFFLVVLWTLERPVRCPWEDRGFLAHSGSTSNPAISYALTVNYLFPLGGDSAVSIYDLCLLKIVWEIWNIKERSSLIIKHWVDCLCSPLDRMGTKNSLNTLQKDLLTYKKTFSPRSKRLCTCLETLVEELQHWSSPVRSSSPRWIPNNLKINYEAHSIVTELVSSVPMLCQPLSCVVIVWVSPCNSWTPIGVKSDQHWSLLLMSEPSVLLRDSPSVTQPTEADFSDLY